VTLGVPIRAKGAQRKEEKKKMKERDMELEV
jgi:hypothetical protein